MTARFIQIHFLTSYPAALLNRDDAGFAKRIPFGGAERLRISSQCLKRHWRVFDGNFGLKTLGVDGSVRSRRTFEEFIRKPLVVRGYDEKIVQGAVNALLAELLGESKKASSKKAKNAEATATVEATTSQLTVLGRPEIDYLFKVAQEICENVSTEGDATKAVKDKVKEIKSNLKGLKMAAGLDAALFGRMVTSDALARGDAAVHVAHAFTVHEESSESDYFAAIDDLLNTDSDNQTLGSAHINSVELTSGLYYGYVVVDVPLLISNLEGCKQSEWLSADKELASKVVSQLIQLVAKVTPGAKLGSTAPYSYANMLLVEAGDDQPRTLANAFMRPVKQRPDLLQNSYLALSEYLGQLKAMYGNANDVVLAAIGGNETFKDVIDENKTGKSLEQIADWAREKVVGNG